MCSSDEIRDSIRELSLKLDDHVLRFEVHEERELDNCKLFSANQREVVDAVKDLTEKTHGMIEAWEAAEGVVKVGATLGKIAKWASGFAVLGGILHWLGVNVPK